MRKMSRFFSKGHMIDKQPLLEFIRTNTFNLTFREGYEKTKIKINVTITDSVYQKFRLCNYITTPNLYIWSAALASCSLPYVYESSKLYYKGESAHDVDYLEDGRKFVDGSIGCDLPMKQMSTLYNISNVIVSQCNPYMVPFLPTSEIIQNHKRYCLYQLKEKLFYFLGTELNLRIHQFQKYGWIPRKLELLANLGDSDFWIRTKGGI